MAVVLCLKYNRSLRDRGLAKRKVSSDVAPEEGPAGPNDVNCTSTQVNVTDLEEPEMGIIKQVQRNEFPSELKSLQDIKEKVIYGSRKSDKEKKACLRKQVLSACWIYNHGQKQLRHSPPKNLFR